jgi:hypothetical protein
MDQANTAEFNKLNQRFDTLMDFLRQHVPTKEELSQELTKLREEVATKEELRLLTNSIDAYAKIAKDYYQEVTIMGARVSRMEAWIMTAAAKFGLDYKP